MKIMKISKSNLSKWILYATLFVLTTTLTAFLFAIVFWFTSLFLWLIIPSSLIYCVTTLISIGLFLYLLLVSWRKRMGWIMAISLGGTLVPCLILVLMLVSLFIKIDRSSHQKPNQRQPLKSPSGKYVLTVPIERSKERRGSLGFGSPYWHVTISDPNGNILYRDPEEDFPGWFGTYWVWDEEDRVWLYASDTGTVFYECVDGIWTRHERGYVKKGHGEKDIKTPESLYPR
jgi:amino acid transporter